VCNIYCGVNFWLATENYHIADDTRILSVESSEGNASGHTRTEHGVKETLKVLKLVRFAVSVCGFHHGDKRAIKTWDDMQERDEDFAVA
jgi:hypothetical protein